MYFPIPSQKSCARAWVAAASAIADAKEAYNVIIDISRPAHHDTLDHAVISLVDRFLRARDQNPVSTVANTIFPQALYEEYGAPRFFHESLKVFDSLSYKGWGRYFERMMRHKKLDGTEYNPLALLIDRLRDRRDAQKYTSAYELAVYDPLLDGRIFRGGQCLSFLSFKLHPVQGLTLTAMYRNHTYVTRCLGNLIGLGRLQAFVAKEAGFPLGSLTCISTHAELDTGKGWGIKDARKLVSDAVALVEDVQDSCLAELAVESEGECICVETDSTAPVINHGAPNLVRADDGALPVGDSPYADL